ncbi:hypothetical protein PIB30_072700 [Stylosanthes scabra]|uniref:Uncharacterized protein n=1 Tax=Stylosanthes scabra TaxID=79078 RepID=A0ABU6TNT8_9FABA|nr:hypothetical protein [Stylosanthes scabra]
MDTFKSRVLRPLPVGGSSSKGKGVEDEDRGKKKAWEARDDGDSDEDEKGVDTDARNPFGVSNSPPASAPDRIK